MYEKWKGRKRNECEVNVMNGCTKWESATYMMSAAVNSVNLKCIVRYEE